MTSTISHIIYKELTSAAVEAEERLELEKWLHVSAHNRGIYDRLRSEAGLKEELLNRFTAEVKVEDALQEFVAKYYTQHEVPVHRVHFLRTTWVRYAAAIIIIAGLGAYLWTAGDGKRQTADKNGVAVAVNDVAPGGNKATLTLADGTKIILDSAANGKLAEQGTSLIEKKEGQIVYSKLSSPVSRLPSPVSFNTMSTPRGGQYQLRLPDGSLAWLNAESSITYPAVFSGNERRVQVKGEVYFEVAKNKDLPFRVEAREQVIEVLGTHFNVNTYSEESTYNTTLLEGSVQIKTVHTSLTLKPGQQGQFIPAKEQLSLALHPDLQQVMAWTTGEFNFNDLKLEEAMQQLSRWYDVEVVYEGAVPKVRFGGEMGRDLKLSQVVKALGVMGVHFRIEGKKLIVAR
jgi:ferric-dicitrate binding protein FerR (iron transport regulator)